MRALLLALLLAAPAAAQDEEIGPRAQDAQRLVRSLSTEARLELKKMYRGYQAAVARRLNDGWEPGLREGIVKGLLKGPYMPARQIEEAIERRPREVDELAAAAAKPSPDEERGERLRKAADLSAKRRSLKSLISAGKRSKGVPRDWSDQVWSEFAAMELKRWTIRDESLGSRAAAVACAPVEFPNICLAFDPWETGSPSVYSYQAWSASARDGRLSPEFLEVLGEESEEP